MRVGVIGGGAAGFFAAINCKEKNPNFEVSILEKSNKVLSKVKVSGGGRCNVTHACFSIAELSKFYPRGEKQLKKAFGKFYTKHTVEWFKERGVELKTEADNRMFPTTDSSQTIIDCFLHQIKKLDINIRYQSNVTRILEKENGFELTINEENHFFDRLIVTTGGAQKTESYNWLKELGHEINEPVPSLFTFNMPNETVKELMGAVAPNAAVRIEGSKVKTDGPLLITHWGMSGPAVLKASAWGARVLAEKNYNFTALVNWINISNEDEIRQALNATKDLNLKKQISNAKPFELPNKLWNYLLERVGINIQTPWNDIGKKAINKLVNTLMNDPYKVEGKTTFKEEFVTCGGIALSNINLKTMESKVCPGMYFAGEVLDIDGVTGGFNFQAAWTTGFIAGTSV